jgi:TonB family protein
MQAPEVESGAVDREKLASYVRSRKTAIQQCYEKELKRNPSLKGKIVVRFTISTAGRATEIDIEENSLNNEAVASCIKTVIRGWVFPFKPPSDVPVAYPFVFAPAT